MHSLIMYTSFFIITIQIKNILVLIDKDIKKHKFLANVTLFHLLTT